MLMGFLRVDYISYWISLEFTNKRKVRKVKNLKVFLCVLKTLRS